MPISSKIRILLILLTLSFIVTAITLQKSITSKDILNFETANLESKIHEKEEVIDELFADPIILKTFKNAEKYPEQSYHILEKYNKDEGIALFIFKNHELLLWSTNLFVPLTDAGLKNPVNYIATNDRSFVVKKKEIGNTTVLAYVMVKKYFNINNEYFTKAFSPLITKSTNIEIADYDDNVSIKNIYSKDKTYLFSIKLKSGQVQNIFSILQTLCWILAATCFITLIHNLAKLLVNKEKIIPGILLYLTALIVLRYLDLNSNWLNIHANLGIFNPKNYAYNYLFPNIWGLLITVFFIFLFILFLYNIKDSFSIEKYLKKKGSKIIFAVLSILSVYFFFTILYRTLGTLITHSTTTVVDFTKLVELNIFTWIDLFIMCVSLVTLILYIDLVISNIKKLQISDTVLINIHLSCLILFILIGTSLSENNGLVNILLALIILIRSFNSFLKKKFRLATHIIVIILLSTIFSIYHGHFFKMKKLENMKLFISNLEAEDDINAISLYTEIEKDILNDEQLKHLFKISLPNTSTQTISEYIEKKYLSGYLSRYEFLGFYYNNNKELAPYKNNKVDEYREKVIKNSLKISNNFYRLNSELGTHEYFSIINIQIDKQNTVSLYLNLKNRSFNYSLPYPDILVDSRLNKMEAQSFNNSSIALFKDGNLVTQYGKYNYPSHDNGYPKKLGEYINLDSRDDYFHIMYRPNNYTTFLVSYPKETPWEYLATASFLFLVIFIFFSISSSVRYGFKILKNKSFKIRSIKYHFLFLVNSIQYSSRIQTLFISSIVLAILISGIISFVSISMQLSYNNTLEREKTVTDISKRLESIVSTASTAEEKEERLIYYLKLLSESLSKDFSLYSKSGRLLFSSQPKIYDLNILSTFINPSAFRKLSLLKKSETIEEEVVGDFKYESSYATIRDENYATIAYLGIPNFNAQKDDNLNKNLLLNTLINIYSLIIIGFGFYAAFVANKITEPLNLISKKIAQTNLGQQNEPLFWQRNDEIGGLIKEYNLMILKLEDYANKIKDNERESTWREMAQQVAHEIKNPLTPMKLGIQQLTKSYYDNDAKFEERFKRITASFIEQINSLTHIAKEFSAFAKLPDTKYEKVNLVEKINKSIAVYSQNPHAQIQLMNQTNQAPIFVEADRDQLLRTFNNLLKNAIEAGFGKRKIKIDISISNGEHDTYIIKIKDNGLGIPQEMRAKIFEINFTTKSSGTGLGLVFVKKTIEAMGGTVKFDSIEDQGTTFQITVPKYRGS
ncbi:MULTISPECIES: HAMP domain-containing sensor histidine kinase [Sphingobacterium]|uniref:HAMP domain-containing sensor histidine kinase n=2 Tax=Sphingobacteriaceae TaxID=84566 RepID=UPI00293BBCF5|nr:HAMP domain-containing sensor histidine kinase [Sphingobacterium sp. B16(2022)]